MAGFCQVLLLQALEYLEQFCSQTLDIRSVGNALEHKQIAEVMPALWPNLLEVLSKFLADEVSSIIVKLIEIRRKTFLNAATRTEDDYIGWEESELEHPTQFYLNWKILRYSKRYGVRNIRDCEFCENSFNKHTYFSYGVFSVGCACPLNITYALQGECP